MYTMKLASIILLLFLVLGLYFKSTDAQDTSTNYMEENVTESTSALPADNTEAPTELYADFPKATISQTVNVTEESTAVNTTLPQPEIVQATPDTASETTTLTAAQTEQTTMTATTVLDNVETTVAEHVPSDAPSTSPYETTVGFNSPTEGITTSKAVESTTAAVVHPTEITTVTVVHPTEITTVTLVHPEKEITTKAVVHSTETTKVAVVDPTEISTGVVVHPKEEITTEAVTMTTTSTEALNTISDPLDPLSTTPNTATDLKNTLFDNKTTPTWIFVVVCVVFVCCLCVGIVIFAKRRKKNTSGSFGPVYTNGQSKRSKKKKGTEIDAWAGPVNLEAGVECDTDVQEGLLPNDGKQNGDDVVLSTFAALDEVLDMSDGGVGGEGTKEAQKWEEKEPMPYIDEDVDEHKAGKTLVENEKINGVKKSEEKELNGGEAFCITTAV